MRQLHRDVTDTVEWVAERGHRGLLEEDQQDHRGTRSRGRWGLAQERLPEDRSKRSIRSLRRLELIAEAVREAPPGVLSHSWVAEHSGLPEGYVAHAFPSIQHLAELADPTAAR